MIIYFTRHGETEWNKKGILQGWKDSALTSKGKELAEKKGRVLVKESIDIIYSSDLGRCLKTAEIINKYLKVKIIKTQKLREQNFGRLNGKPNIEVEKSQTGGESFNDMKKRVALFVKSLSAKNHKKVLLVTHDGPAKAILSEYYKKCAASDRIIYIIEKNKIKKLKA